MDASQVERETRVAQRTDEVSCARLGKTVSTHDLGAPAWAEVLSITCVQHRSTHAGLERDAPGFARGIVRLRQQFRRGPRFKSPRARRRSDAGQHEGLCERIGDHMRRLWPLKKTHSRLTCIRCPTDGSSLIVPACYPWRCLWKLTSIGLPRQAFRALARPERLELPTPRFVVRCDYGTEIIGRAMATGGHLRPLRHIAVSDPKRTQAFPLRSTTKFTSRPGIAISCTTVLPSNSAITAESAFAAAKRAVPCRSVAPSKRWRTLPLT
jgi:hypothetical protein